MSQGHVLVDETREKCILIGVITQTVTETQAVEYIDELEFLAETAGMYSEKRFFQKLAKPDSKTYLGSGKLEEVRMYINANNIGIAIFDDELSPSQLRNIEKVLEIRILDRNNLILNIFASRARTASAKTQVELAQMQYLLPRLTRMWTHLDREKGGIGMRSGAGETQIEVDRRLVQDKIAALQKKLKAIDKQKSVQRGNRGQLVRVALVGYTNAGKSTVMNMLSKSDVFAENKLFATLDTTVRKVVIENLPFLLADTVGFIRKLPHQLVDSFKSTLDEVRESDLMVHIVDISHPSFEDHYNVVCNTLTEIDKSDKPSIVVFNKVDAYTFIEKDEDDLTPKEQCNYSLDDLKKTWMSKLNDTDCVFISAIDKGNIEEFKSILYKKVKLIFQERYPYHNFLY
ncbi:MAG: GTPase HflX [Flavobacteriales bacterium]|nr:GTPase HflX [Flavobacteriales bacterium]